ncbi:DeoR/GlpR family DNA-binding transcription regulator [Chthonobacter rhizosphaerae]|uniref:DeoR/GlpR family DNA-binding transcription regulator n=1 Tax=Chthonobacter rhizosphaerae TaxID=2735553 RepID=UPI0015EE8D44|nr:DeoR/GlpR family DNA-binding transcription regulator [Chthonobacter rhizosphaerae]
MASVVGETERQDLIRKVLKAQPFVTVRDLVSLTNASPATVRRDIDKLNEAGEVRKVFGGIASVEPAAARERLSARPFDENRMLAVDAKKAIAAEAERLCRDGDSLIVHGGTTCYLFGVLLARRAVKIFTNSMPLAAALAETGTCHLTVAGGELHREPGILQMRDEDLLTVYASKFFVGAQGIGPDGVMESHPLLVRSVEMLIPRTDKVVVLADSRKFSIRPRHVVFGLGRIGTLITDDGLSDQDARMLEDEGVTVVVASAR